MFAPSHDGANALGNESRLQQRMVVWREPSCVYPAGALAGACVRTRVSEAREAM